MEEKKEKNGWAELFLCVASAVCASHFSYQPTPPTNRPSSCVCPLAPPSGSNDVTYIRP